MAKHKHGSRFGSGWFKKKATNEGQLNFELPVASREAAEGFINGDDVAQETYQTLKQRGLSHGEARNEIGRVLLAITWAIEHGYLKPDNGDDMMYSALKRIADGESAASLFHDGWKGESL